MSTLRRSPSPVSSIASTLSVHRSSSSRISLPQSPTSPSTQTQLPPQYSSIGPPPLVSPTTRPAQAVPPGTIARKPLPVSTQSQLKPRSRSGWWRLGQYWWAWQILAAALSLAATAALIITLIEIDGHKQYTLKIGHAHVTLNAIIALISTVIRTSLFVTVGGALSQGAWNWFASSRKTGHLQPGKPLKDLDIFGDASFDSWSSLKLLYITRFRSVEHHDARFQVADFPTQCTCLDWCPDNHSLTSI